jgi:hypothetical protein
VEAAFRAAWLIFGPVVATWTVQQLREWASSQLGLVDANPMFEHLARPCDLKLSGLDLDPDDGCFYWELPTREQ